MEIFNLIFLDTNIYRQMGNKFNTHTHYKNLEEYCKSGNAEIGVFQTVMMEYLHYYNNEVLAKNIDVIEKSMNELKGFEAFKKIKIPNYKLKLKSELSRIEKTISRGLLLQSSEKLLTEELLTTFLLASKTTKKDNTRDLLIWLSAIAAAKRERKLPNLKYRIILISNDKIFQGNPALEEIKKKHKANNIEVYESIGAFLSDFGYISPNLNKALLLNSISEKELKQHLLKNSNQILSEISYFYKKNCEKNLQVDFINIDKIEIEAFYGGKHSRDSDIVKIYADVIIKVDVVFEAESDADALNNYLNNERDVNKYYLETFIGGRPVFDNYILCITFFSYSISRGKIIDTRFYEIMPDFYDVIKWRKILQLK